MTKRKKILITGTSGFIGKNLKEQLKDKYHLLSPTHKQLELLNSESVAFYLKTNKPDVVIHAALIGGGQLKQYTSDYFYQNLKMFFNLVQNRKYFGKMIHFGSGAEYDKSSEIKKVKETEFGEKIPSDYYGFFKYICAKFIEQSDNVVNLRVFGLYGKYEDWPQRFISNAICRNLLNLPITISKDVYFDYVYIDDLVKIVEHFINHNGKHRSYNIGTGKPINLFTIAQKINKVSANKSEIIISEKGFKNEYTCNNQRLLSEIEGFNFSSFDQSLIAMIAWYKKNLNRINLESLVSLKG